MDAKRKLRAWLDQQPKKGGYSPSRLADELGVSRGTVYAWLDTRIELKPRVDLAVRLERLTGGDVSVVDW